MLFRLGDDATTDDIGMPVQILGGRVNHHIDTMLERSLAIGGQEGVVRDGDQSRRFRHLGNGCNVNDVKQGIAGSFDPDALGPGGNRLADLFDISHADKDEVDPHVAKQRIEQPVGSAIDVMSRDDLITGLEHVHRCRDRRHPRAGGSAIESPFEGGNVFFECPSGRITTAGVIESPVCLEIIPAKRRRRVDRSSRAVIG